MSRGRLASFLADLWGRSDARFADLLCRQVDAAVAAAELLRRAAVGEEDLGGVADALRDAEHEGDRWRSELIAELGRALTTPVDREDLFRLSRSIDDVLDYLRDFAVELSLYKVPSAERYGPCTLALVEALRVFRDVVAKLDADPRQLAGAARDAKHANRAHSAYIEAMVQLLDGELTTEVLKHRELLRRLDIAGLRLEQAADVLSDAALKRS